VIPFNGQFAEDVVLPLAQAAYNSKEAPQGFVVGSTAFEIRADTGDAGYAVQFARSSAAHQKMMQSMVKQPPQNQQASTQDAIMKVQPNPAPNLDFGWVCVDTTRSRLIVAFRGTEFLHDWFDNFDFIPAPYGPIPGRGTVHQGFQLLYYSIRASLRALVGDNAPRCKELLITGHSLGGALCALAAPDLLNDNPTLAPLVYTWAEPRVGHGDFVTMYNTHVNVSYRLANVWDVVPHLPPDIAGYEHEGNQVTIDSGFSLDVVRNHVLPTGYAPAIHKWNQDHPVRQTTHFGRTAASALVGKTA
jgi:triacylglycerol lipase